MASARTTDSMFTMIFIFVFVMVLLLAQTINASISNMYVIRDPAHEGTTWGKYCYSNGGYTPTCGWKMILSASYTVHTIEVWHSSTSKINDFTYQLTPNDGYENSLTRVGQCSSITIHGSFGSTQPEIAITYSCVCLSPDDGCTPVPYTLLPPWDADPPPDITMPPEVVTTTTQEVTTTTTTDLQTTSSTPQTQTTASLLGSPSANNGWVMTFSNSNVSSIKLINVKDACYTGASVQEMPSSVSHLPDCGSFCLVDDKCEGVNFYSGADLCFLVHTEVDEGDGDLTNVSGCQFWRVLWKK